MVSELDEPRIRELFVDSFRLIYQVAPTEVFVLAFVHGARDLDAMRPLPADERVE